MLLSALIKNKIFPNPMDKQRLIKKVGGANFKDAFNCLFFEMSERDLQVILASFLREKTVDYMSWAETECMRELRTQFQVLIQVDGAFDEYQSWPSLIEGQKKNKKWGTNFEAVALAEILDLGLLVRVGESRPYRIGTISEGKLIISLHQKGYHWFLEDGYNKTLADGNCLYNAFSRALRFNLLMEDKQKLSFGIKLDERISVYKTQSELLSIYQRAPIPSVEELKKRIVSSVNPREQGDYQLPVQFVQEEINGALVVKTSDDYIKDFEYQLNEMRQKKRALKRKAKLEPLHYKAAFDAAVKLTGALSKCLLAFKQKHDYIKFNAACTEAINEATKTLDPFPSWKQILTNMVAFVVGLGAFYVGAVIYNKLSTGRFMLFPPAFVEKGDAKECAKTIAQLRGVANNILNGPI